MAFALKLLLGLLLLVPAWAQPIEIIYLEGSLSAQEEPLVKKSLDWIATTYEKQGLTPTRIVRARVFPTVGEFYAYQRRHRSHRDGSPLSSTGYFSTGMNEVVVWRSQRFLAVLIHEAHHALLRSTFKNPPKWLNEGLSECFEGLALGPDGEIQLTPQGPRLRKVKRNFGPNFGRQALEMLNLSGRQFNARSYSRGLDSYTLSWALSYFLWTRENGPELVASIISELKLGETSQNAVARLYPGGLDQLASDLQNFYFDLTQPGSTSHKHGSVDRDTWRSGCASR